MKKAKCLISFVMCLSILCTCFTGCQKGPEENASPAGSASPSSGAQLPPVTLNYWIIGPGKQKRSDKVWAEFNKEIQQYLPNTTVNFTVVSADEYATRWASAMAAREQIDLAWTGWMLKIQDEANAGSLKPLDELISKYGRNVVDSLSQKVVDMYKMNDGKVYQIPAWQGLVGNRSAVRFPKELADLVSPTYTQDLQNIFYSTWQSPSAKEKSKAYDKIEEYLKAAKDAGKIEKGLQTGDGGLAAWYCAEGTASVAPFAFVNYNDSTFTVKSSPESEMTKMHYRYMAEWFKKGYIRPDIASAKATSPSWTNNKTWKDDYIVRFHNGFTDDLAATETLSNGFETVVAYTKPDTEYTLGSATGTSIPTTSKNPERAMMLIDLLYSDNGTQPYRTFSYGIKGEDYIDNGDGTGKTLNGTGQAQSSWAYGMWKWTLGTCLHSLTMQGDAKGYYEALKAKEATSYVSPLLTFQFDNTNVKTLQAQLDTVDKEYTEILNRGYMGDGWEAKYNEYVSKLKSAGLDDFLAEVQKQVTVFVQKNRSKW